MTGRFINIDSKIVCNCKDGYNNLFCYCNNAPIIKYDPSGKLGVCVELYMQALIWVKPFYSETRVEDYSPIAGFINTPLGDALTESLMYSDQFIELVKEYIAIMEEESLQQYSNSEPIFFDFDIQKHTLSNNDLALGVGRVETLPITVTKVASLFGHNLYKIDYTIQDKFDFEDFSNEKRNQFVIWLNQNLGYYPQEKGIIKKFNWKCSGSFLLLQ